MQSVTNQSFKQYQMPTLAIDPQAFQIISDPVAFKNQLLTLIAAAQRRIYITALYIEQDEVGTQVLEALFVAKQKNPTLDIQVFVDFHRAQRGRIGERGGQTNQAFYAQLSAQYTHAIGLYGVAIKSRELLGVLHLKGIIIDDTLLYSGASINNVYFAQGGRYRLDRYHQVQHGLLADAFVSWLQTYFLESPATCDFLKSKIPAVKTFRRELKRMVTRWKKSAYIFKPSKPTSGQVALTPLIGLGIRSNQLNQTISYLLASCEQQLCLYTPYFNLPRAFAIGIKRLLKRQVQVTILVGDKTASDFYIPPDQPFSVVGALPYLYEHFLRQFMRRYQSYLDTGLLKVFLWKHQAHSFHLKGICVDERFHLLTGSNLNPRARALDIENGLFLQDPHQYLWPQFAMEQEKIFQQAKPVTHYHHLQQITDYPEPVQRVLRRVFRLKANVLLRRVL